MKRILIIILLIVSIWFAYRVVSEGFTIDKFNLDISSYEGVQKDSDKMTKELANYERKNKNEYNETLESLSSAITKYEDTKEEYNQLIEDIGLADEEEEEIVIPQKEVYNIDVLWVKIGLYAEKHGVNIDLIVEKDNTVPDTSSIGYTTAKLHFLINGSFIGETEFIEDIESDDELGFEIRDFRMYDEGASFYAYGVPLNNEVLSGITGGSSSDGSGAGSSSGSSSSGSSSNSNTVGNETVAPTNNTTSNTTSNNTTNSTANNTSNSTNETSNSVSNNTTNNTVN